MKTKVKALLLTCCAVLLVTATVFVTVAYLTSKDEVTNTFTVGKVAITLDEADVNEYGVLLDSQGGVYDAEKEGVTLAARVAANEYKLMPGHTYVKDPTVHIAAGSEEAYYRMLVTVNFDNDISELAGTDLSTIFTGYNTKWERTGYSVAEDGKSISYEYRYNTTVANNTESVKDLEPLFQAITVPTNLTNDTLAVFADMEINIVAQAIQADGFANADAAWDAFPEQ